MGKQAGGQSILLTNRPQIEAFASVVGKKEGEGPLAAWFDQIGEDTKFGQPSWEKAESRMQELALEHARRKAGIENDQIDMLFAGDLLNQCVGSSFCLRDTGIPFLGLYGACSTMAESLLLAGIAIDGEYASRAAAMTSSHFAGAERQYRFPLSYGGQRTPTAQWTVTGAGCLLLRKNPGGKGPYLSSATIGRIVDLGVKDANNMGAAMAPAAYDTILAHFRDLSLRPEDYDLIVTGDLGETGSRILCDLFHKDGIELKKRHFDCGCAIFDAKRQDVHAGGSGCGCSASTLCGYLLRQMQAGRYHRILFCATGALLSPLSTQQGESVPGVCHAVAIHAEGY
ncbi:MAG: stage V sporulation protein AD [Oscillospiraceae bacterium]|nr:stage V sporulation protein AD [Oscillospiraceae bacterium]